MASRLKKSTKKKSINRPVKKHWLVHETPVKAMSLLTISLFSLAFLFSVSFTDAGFKGATRPMPDPFAPKNVMAALDNLSLADARLFADFPGPVKQAFAYHAEGFSWILDNSDEKIVYYLGLESLVSPNNSLLTQSAVPRVAGASIINQQDTFNVKAARGLSVDTLYSLLIN